VNSIPIREIPGFEELGIESGMICGFGDRSREEIIEACEGIVDIIKEDDDDSRRADCR